MKHLRRTPLQRRHHAALVLLLAPALTVLASAPSHAAWRDDEKRWYISQPDGPYPYAPDVVADCAKPWGQNNEQAVSPEGWHGYETPTSCNYNADVVKPYAAKGAAQKVSGDVNTCGKAAGTIAKTITTSVSNTVTTTDGTSTSIGANIQLSSAVMLTVNTETNHQYSTSSTTATTESTTYTLAAPANMISYMQFRPYIIYSKGHIVAHYQYPTHGSTTWTSGVVTSVIPMTLGDGSLDGEFTVISRSC